MTFNYNNDPAGDDIDAVRFLVGDTVKATAMVQDEEIEYALAVYPKASGKPPWLAAAHVCDGIAGKFARKVQQSIGGALSASNQQQYEHYLALAQQFRVLHATNGKGVLNGSMAGVTPAAPILSGGGSTVLGGGTYNPLKGSV